MAPKQGNRQIFISHRHDDKGIADVIRQHLLDWGISPGDIFQSSAVGHGLTAGAPLVPQIRDRLATAKLFVLIYTCADYDWSWCMWECGIASVARPGMKIVVFQFREDEPKVTQDLVRLKITREDILKFVSQFHKSDNFFPDEPAFLPDITEDSLKRKANRLYEELLRVSPPGECEVRHRWDFLRVTLSAKNVPDIKQEENEQQAIELIKGKCLVTYAFGKAFEHFGYAAFQSDQYLVDMVKRWQAVSGERQPQEWVNELYAEIWRAVRNMPSEPPGKYFKSAVTGTDWWFLPVVNIVRIGPDSTMEFDVYLYRQVAG